MRLRSTEILVPAGWRWMASTAAHRTSLQPCLVDLPAADNRIGLAVSRGQSGPRTQATGIDEAVHVTDLSDEHRTEDGADAGQLLNRPIAAIGAKLGGDLVGESALVGVENVDSSISEVTPLRVRGAERNPLVGTGGTRLRRTLRSSVAL